MFVAKRFNAILFSFWMSVFMAFIMSGVLVFIHSGLEGGFVMLWMQDFLLAFIVAFPTTLLVSPLAGYLTALLSKAEHLEK